MRSQRLSRHHQPAGADSDASMNADADPVAQRDIRLSRHTSGDPHEHAGWFAMPNRNIYDAHSCLSSGEGCTLARDRHGALLLALARCRRRHRRAGRDLMALNTTTRRRRRRRAAAARRRSRAREPCNDGKAATRTVAVLEPTQRCWIGFARLRAF